MLTKEIKSLQHPFIKHVVKLRKERNYRELHHSVLVAGKTLVQELSPLKTLFIAKNIPLSCDAEEQVRISEEMMKKITGLENPEPVAALVAMPKPANLDGKKYILALDRIADPGNLGTLVRTALALGWEGLFLIEGSSDLFNDKAVRAAKGANFRLPFAKGTCEELEKLIQKNQLNPCVATMQGVSLAESRLKTPLLLILGNESNGHSSFAKERYLNISIPMLGHIERFHGA